MKKAINGLYVVPLLLAACGGSEEQLAGGGAMPPMAVQVHVLQAEPLDNSNTTTGTLMSNEEVDLVSELAGRVTMIGFQEGGNVSAGQVLVRINDDDLQAQFAKDIKEVVESEAFAQVMSDPTKIFKDFQKPEWLKAKTK